MTIARTVSRRSPSVARNRPGDALDERRGRVVRHEALAELERDVARRRGLMREHLDGLLALLDAAAGGKPLPEDDLLARVVQARAEDERRPRLAASRGARTIDQPVRTRASSVTSFCV